MKNLLVAVVSLLIAFLIGIFMCYELYAAELQLKPFATYQISDNSKLEFGHGIGAELDYIFDNGFLAFGSCEFTPVSYNDHNMGNLNTSVLGIGYKKQYTYFNWFAKAGYVFIHDSDMERLESYQTTKTVQINQVSRCCKPQHTQVTETFYNRTKIGFSDGYVVELGGGYSYPISKVWSVGVDLSGRYMNIGHEIKLNGLTLDDDNIEKFDAKGMVSFTLRF